MTPSDLAREIALLGRQCGLHHWSEQQLLTYATEVADGTMATRADVLCSVWDGLLAGFRFWQIRQSFEVDAKHGYDPGTTFEWAILSRRHEQWSTAKAGLEALVQQLRVTHA